MERVFRWVALVGVFSKLWMINLLYLGIGDLRTWPWMGVDLAGWFFREKMDELPVCWTGRTSC